MDRGLRLADRLRPAPLGREVAAIASSVCSRSWRHSAVSMSTQSSYQSGSRSADNDATVAAVASGASAVRRVRETTGERLRLTYVDHDVGGQIEIEIGDVDGRARLTPQAGERGSQARRRLLLGGVGPQRARDHESGHRPVAEREQRQQSLRPARQRGAVSPARNWKLPSTESVRSRPVPCTNATIEFAVHDVLTSRAGSRSGRPKWNP